MSQQQQEEQEQQEIEEICLYITNQFSDLMDKAEYLPKPERAELLYAIATQAEQQAKACDPDFEKELL